MKSDGKIGFGTLTPSTKFEFYGNGTKFSFPPAGFTNAAIILDAYYADTRFYPETTLKGYLGMTSKYWYRLYVDQAYFHYHTNVSSDIKFKKNIAKINDPLGKVLKLNSVEYNIKPETMGMTDPVLIEELEKKKHFGLIAQEVQEIIPDIVEEDSMGLSISYSSLIPYLIDAIQEQQKMILSLEEKMKEKDNSATAKSAEETISNTDLAASLGQNQPNPFNENTKINYYLAESTETAVLYIYDMRGTQLKSIPVHQKGSGSLTINGGEFKTGMYLYTLIADDLIVDTKQMILTN